MLPNLPLLSPWPKLSYLFQFLYAWMSVSPRATVQTFFIIWLTSWFCYSFEKIFYNFYLIEVPFWFLITNSEKKTFIECVIFLLLLNMFLCDKYEAKANDFAPSVELSHYDCSGMTKNNLYSLNNVKPCIMSPQINKMNDVKLTMYTKHFWAEINVTICRIKHQGIKFCCRKHDHTSMDIEQPQITSDLDLFPEQCKQASEAKSLKLFDHKHNSEKSRKKRLHKRKGGVNGEYVR